MTLPFAEACEQNKQVIFDAIAPWLRGEILEIGSGTGQHAVYFAGRLPGIVWQTSDRAENLPGIRAWIEDSGLDNLPAPLELDVCSAWPEAFFDMVFSANCFHIMHPPAVAASIEGAGRVLRPDGVLAVYGPFNYGGRYTSASNAQFDQFLRARDPDSGIRDFDWLDGLAREAGLQLLQDIEMPANNRTLIWQNRT